MTDPSVLKPTALIIDDEVQMRRLLRVNLESNGYRVLEAASGQEGFSVAMNFLVQSPMAHHDRQFGKSAA